MTEDAARAVLLERSPHESDGGELVDRDPRKVTEVVSGLTVNGRQRPSLARLEAIS